MRARVHRPAVATAQPDDVMLAEPEVIALQRTAGNQESIARLKALRARVKDATALDAVLRRLKAENKAYARIADAVVK